uniref:Zinc finger protein 281 n=1 Tax=Knipowitschia caucasica TaxID=637954 RepID=A0AAV2KEA1_KNICA
MSLIQDKLGNEFLRSNSSMDSNYGAGMIMFSHLPPVTSFTRLAAQTVMQDLPPPEMILKKERDSPDCSMGLQNNMNCSGVADYVHSMGIKQEKMSEHDYRLPLYPGALGKSAELLEVTVGSSQNLMVHDLNMGHLPSQLGKEPSGKKGRRSNGDGQEGKPRKKRSEKQSMMLDADGGSLSPGTKPHICEHCNAAFRSSYHLRRHVLIHTGERPFRCNQCNMSFIQKYLLQRHEKIHSGEKPFSCDQCNMRFIQKYHMERHKRTHSGEKPYRCETCQQYFSRTDRLLKHKRTCGDAVKKGLDPGMMDMDCVDMGHGSYGISQGNGSSTGRKRRSKNNPDGGERRKKKGDTGQRVPHSQSAVSGGYSIHDYAVENQTVSSTTEPGPSMQHQGRAPKMAFKKAHRNKSAQVKHVAMEQGGAMDGLMQENCPKATSSHHYDDAMQFIKKKRYLHAANSANSTAPVVSAATSSEYDVGHLSSQAAMTTVMDPDPHLILDKTGIPDEVLQSLLEHYSQKADGSNHEVYDLSDAQVELAAAAAAAGLVHLDTSSPSVEKNNMMNEYSRFLLQALERTSNNGSFPVGPSPPSSGPYTSSHPGTPLYSDKSIYASSPLDCGYGQSVASPSMASAVPKSHFTLLTGSSPQHSFHLSGLEPSHQQLTPSQELTEQLDKAHSSTPPSSYMGPSDLSVNKEQVKNGSAVYPLVPSQELTPLDSAKPLYQIENFAQAFGSQFKPESLSYGADSGEVDHRTSEFSGAQRGAPSAAKPAPLPGLLLLKSRCPPPVMGSSLLPDLLLLLLLLLLLGTTAGGISTAQNAVTTNGSSSSDPTITTFVSLPASSAPLRGDTTILSTSKRPVPTGPTSAHPEATSNSNNTSPMHTPSPGTRPTTSDSDNSTTLVTPGQAHSTTQLKTTSNDKTGFTTNGRSTLTEHTLTSSASVSPSASRGSTTAKVDPTTANNASQDTQLTMVTKPDNSTTAETTEARNFTKYFHRKPLHNSFDKHHYDLKLWQSLHFDHKSFEYTNLFKYYYSLQRYSQYCCTKYSHGKSLHNSSHDNRIAKHKPRQRHGTHHVAFLYPKDEPNNLFTSLGNSTGNPTGNTSSPSPSATTSGVTIVSTVITVSSATSVTNDTATQAPTGGSTGTTITTTTSAAIVCPEKPCPAGSVCLNGACACVAGSYFNNGQCVKAQVFPGQLRVTSLTFSTEMSNRSSPIFQKTAKDISTQLFQILKDQKGYVRSDIIMLTQGSVVATVDNIYEDTKVSESDVNNAIDEAIMSASSGILSGASYKAADLCQPGALSPCDVVTTSCTSVDGQPTCSCLSGYVPFNQLYSNTSCKACPSGQKAVGNTCHPCSFGYAGFNCNDPALLAVVVVSFVLGGILLILVLALIGYCCCKSSSSKSSSEFNSPYSVNSEQPWPSEVPHIPRASTNWDSGPSMELTEGASTRALVDKKNHNGLTGSYDLQPDDLKTFKGKNTSRYSYLVQGHENPYFLPGDEVPPLSHPEPVGPGVQTRSFSLFPSRALVQPLSHANHGTVPSAAGRLFSAFVFRAATETTLKIRGSKQKQRGGASAGGEDGDEEASPQPRGEEPAPGTCVNTREQDAGRTGVTRFVL